ncbi:hypothetical protein CONLIGDRAFT_636195 [Coniochaeta ligniaria NRRL 30616]|uniref:Uncharacterized protein n=1 Tax=Coniochaeta ligniaria NRRL 30616 TaxID=1408157 RepID=A0A1J7JBX0_9PEZI|nr:hypothetical protein CONLIGDRAFT_636195 [Coniochaeta ligniaria NRRL 30616]
MAPCRYCSNDRSGASASRCFKAIITAAVGAIAALSLDSGSTMSNDGLNVKS